MNKKKARQGKLPSLGDVILADPTTLSHTLARFNEQCKQDPEDRKRFTRLRNLKEGMS